MLTTGKTKLKSCLSWFDNTSAPVPEQGKRLALTTTAIISSMKLSGKKRGRLIMNGRRSVSRHATVGSRIACAFQRAVCMAHQSAGVAHGFVEWSQNFDFMPARDQFGNQRW